MVAAIRSVELALGDGRKCPAPCELPNLAVVRKSVVAAHDLRAGDRLGRGDVAVKRPGSGIAPGELERVVGRRAARDIAADEVIDWHDLV
jgi:N-acetylneuraminate synthase/N,N'-diacetyllegionaminate synthase